MLIHATVGGVLLGLVCLRSGKMPLELGHLCIFKVRAFLLWLRWCPWPALRRAWEVYPECEQIVRRSV